MTIEKTVQYTLYARTGLGPIDDTNSIGWYIGFIEKGTNAYLFALNLIDKDEMKAATKRIEISKKILQKMVLD
jgi:beta-lactamase class D